MNENKIPCGVCRDLMPLVKDGVASPESESAVRDHISECSECADIFGGEELQFPKSNSEKVISRAKVKSAVFGTAMIIIAFFAFAASLDLFVGLFLMPFIGALGYMAFRNKAFFIVPILLIIIDAAAYLINLISGNSEFNYSMLILSVIFAMMGFIIVFLLKFAFTKAPKGEDKK